MSRYIDTDSSEKQENALLVSVSKKLMKNTFTFMDIALRKLATSAFFFGLRSCEYLNVKGTRKTKQLRIGDIRFFKNNNELKDKSNAFIQFVDTV